MLSKSLAGPLVVFASGFFLVCRDEPLHGLCMSLVGFE